MLRRALAAQSRCNDERLQLGLFDDAIESDSVEPPLDARPIFSLFVSRDSADSLMGDLQERYVLMRRESVKRTSGSGSRSRFLSTP
jgi:hypothetical protein